MLKSVFDLEITDPHHHLWDLEAHSYPGLTNSFAARVCGEYSAIRKNYLLADLQRDIGKLNVTRTVHIEAVIEPSQAVDETAWAQSISDSESSGDIPHGIVAQADFSSDAIDVLLDGHCQSTNIRGIRDVVHEGWIDPANPNPPNSRTLNGVKPWDSAASSICTLNFKSTTSNVRKSLSC